MIYIAVVAKKLWERSGRKHGDWASFVDKNKRAAISAALKAREEWERAGHGPYVVYVGTLTEVAKTPHRYVLRDIVEPPEPETSFPVGLEDFD